MQLHRIDGPAGLIECVRVEPEHCIARAVLCHPHPLYGGSLDDQVLGFLEQGCLQAGVAAVRFNFRGVGDSEGSHDGGGGEVDDLVAVCEWARDRALPLVVCGYSFGAGIAWRGASDVGAKALVLVAPPMAMVEAIRPPAVPTMVFLGRHDELVNYEAMADHLADTPAVIESLEADHFFFGQRERIADRTEAFLSRVLG